MSNNNLAEEFNVDDVRVEIETFKQILSEIKQIPDPSTVIAAAIEKASILIDLVHTEMVNGDMSARYAEVAAGLLTTIIQSSGFLNASMQHEFDNKLKTISSKQKDREIDIKRQELKIKELYYDSKKSLGGGPGPSNNIIVTDYNSIMKFLDGKKKQLAIEG